MNWLVHSINTTPSLELCSYLYKQIHVEAYTQPFRYFLKISSNREIRILNQRNKIIPAQISSKMGVYEPQFWINLADHAAAINKKISEVKT